VTAHGFHVGQRGTLPGKQRELDGQPGLAQDEQVAACQVVNGGGDDALDRGLDRNHGPLGRRGADGVERRADRVAGHRLHVDREPLAGRGQPRHRCLGKRSFRTEIGIAHVLILPQRPACDDRRQVRTAACLALRSRREAGPGTKAASPVPSRAEWTACASSGDSSCAPLPTTIGFA
jgi:hypothetical protein